MPRRSGQSAAIVFLLPRRAGLSLGRQRRARRRPATGRTARRTLVELRRFNAGRALFDKVFTPEEGLGPAFNENQCSACHTVPASGGTTGFERIVKATRFTPPDRCDLLVASGGENVRKQATPLLRSRGIEREPVPAQATEVDRVLPPALFGLGLVEAIPAASIARRADPEDADRDGISGRPGRTADGDSRASAARRSLPRFRSSSRALCGWRWV